MESAILKSCRSEAKTQKPIAEQSGVMPEKQWAAAERNHLKKHKLYYPNDSNLVFESTNNS